MVSIPARIASWMPSSPWAWAATLQAEHVRLVGDRLHLLEAELLRADAVAQREHAAGGADLDHLGAIFVQPAHLVARVLRAR